jgi:hypothetical protein
MLLGLSACMWATQLIFATELYWAIFSSVLLATSAVAFLGTFRTPPAPPTDAKDE